MIYPLCTLVNTELGITTLVYFGVIGYHIYMSTTKERLVVYLDANKAKRVRKLAKEKRWELTTFLEECIDLGLIEYDFEDI